MVCVQQKLRRRHEDANQVNYQPGRQCMRVPDWTNGVQHRRLYRNAGVTTANTMPTDRLHAGD